MYLVISCQRGFWLNGHITGVHPQFKQLGLYALLWILVSRIKGLNLLVEPFWSPWRLKFWGWRLDLWKSPPKPKQLVAKWWPSKNFNLEGCSVWHKISLLSETVAFACLLYSSFHFHEFFFEYLKTKQHHESTSKTFYWSSPDRSKSIS